MPQKKKTPITPTVMRTKHNVTTGKRTPKVPCCFSARMRNRVPEPNDKMQKPVEGD